MEKPVVHILLATYNGEDFLRKQLDSLFDQTYADFLLLARDDGSTDSTMHILSDYRELHPDKMKIIVDDKKNVGATQNFNILLSHSNADYIFFCDQDDIWMEDKIEAELQKIKQLEEKSIPCMVYSDMKLIDEKGNSIGESVWHQLHLHPRFFTLNRLLVQNIPHGCTIAINKAMRDLAYPIPPAALLHDHWIALLAATCGKADFMEKPAVLLRNHAQNVTRKKTSVTGKLIRFASNFFSSDVYEYYIRIRVQQAKALLDRCAGCIKNADRELLEHFIQLERTKGLSRKKIFLQNKFFRTTFLHTLKMVLRA